MILDSTINVTAYPGSANQDMRTIGHGSGWFEITHRGVALDPDVLVSFDGVTDHVRIPLGGKFTAPRTVGPRVWLRLASAGSVRVLVQRTPEVGWP